MKRISFFTLLSVIFILTTTPAFSQEEDSLLKNSDLAFESNDFLGTPDEQPVFEEDTSIDSDLTLDAEVTEEEVVITYPVITNPIVGMEVSRYETTTYQVNEETGEVLIKGDADVKLGAFQIIDNLEDRFRLVMDAEEAPSALQLQGLMPGVGRLAFEIAGDIDPVVGKYSGEIILDFSRLDLAGWMRWDWVRHEFEYFYRESDVIRLIGKLHPVELSGFPFMPQNFRLRPNAFLMDFTLKDKLNQFQMDFTNFEIGQAEPITNEASCKLSFLNEYFPNAKCRFEDSFVLVEFDSDFILGREHQYKLELYSDGTFRLLSALFTESGEIIKLYGRMKRHLDAFHGRAEIHKSSSKEILMSLKSEKLTVHLDGHISGPVSLESGSVAGFTPMGGFFEMTIDQFGKVSYGNLPERVQEPEPLSVVEEAIEEIVETEETDLQLLDSDEMELLQPNTTGLMQEDVE